ncbi:unnamed protein product [Prunus armeniaca]
MLSIQPRNRILAILPREETHRFMVQTIKDINAQVIEDPSLTRNISGESIQAGEVIDLELPSGDKEDETQAEQTAIEATPSAIRNKRKETAPFHESSVQPEVSEEPTAAPTTTSGTDEELRETFEAVEQEKELEEEEGPQEKTKQMEKEAKAAGGPKGRMTSSELALFVDAEAEHSTAVLVSEEQSKQSVLEHRENAELPVATPEAGVEVVAVVPDLVMPIHSFPSSSTTASFADPELAEFEAMDLDAQLDKLEKLSSPPGKAKSKAVDEAMERLKIWQSTELELDENREVVNQLMKDLDLLHIQNMAPKPILEMTLGLARDVLNLHDRYEDLKPIFKTSEFCKATHEANLAYYTKQTAELDQMVAGYKEAKATADRLEKQIEELQKQLVECKEV